MLNPEQLQTIEAYKTLKEWSAGTVLGISELKIQESAHGPVGIGKYLTISTDTGEKEEGKVIIPSRILEEGDVAKSPFILVYLGTKITSSTSRTYYDVKVVKIPQGKDMNAVMCELNSLSFTDLVKTVSDRILADFTNGCVIVYNQMRIVKLPNQQNGKSIQIPIVRFEVEEGCCSTGQTSGRLVLPSRLLPQIQKSPVGILIYNGKKTPSNGGMDYYDVKIVTRKTASVLDEAMKCII